MFYIYFDFYCMCNKFQNHYMELCSQTYREATNEELIAHSSDKAFMKYGIFFTTMVIECKLFLPWALKRYT